MNWLVLISGLFALSAVAGHFTMGKKSFLVPMLRAESVFHYVSVFLVLSAAALILVGFGVDLGSDTSPLIWFVALNYSLLAAVQLTMALTSSIPRPLTKLFQ